MTLSFMQVERRPFFYAFFPTSILGLLLQAAVDQHLRGTVASRVGKITMSAPTAAQAELIRYVP